MEARGAGCLRRGTLEVELGGRWRVWLPEEDPWGLRQVGFWVLREGDS